MLIFCRPLETGSHVTAPLSPTRVPLEPVRYIVLRIWKTRETKRKIQHSLTRRHSSLKFQTYTRVYKRQTGVSLNFSRLISPREPACLSKAREFADLRLDRYSARLFIRRYLFARIIANRKAHSSLDNNYYRPIGTPGLESRWYAA